MNEQYPKFSKEHIIIRELIKESGEIALKWFKNKPSVWKKRGWNRCIRGRHRN